MLLRSASPLFLTLSLLLCPAAYAELLVEKQSFTLASFTTQRGQLIAPVRIGYETYGKLNETKSNAILISHFYSGNSHAAGKYQASDVAPGYWDSIIGPGKAIDTDKYFVISTDSLVNIAPLDPKVITTGPASLNPKTKRPYGLSFPIIELADIVAVQEKLLSSLGIEKLHAVMGASGGAAKALQFAADFPQKTSRAIAVIGPGLKMPPYVVALLNLWSMPIRLDPKWKKGQYALNAQPKEGNKEAIKMVILSATHLDFGEALAKTPITHDPRAELLALSAVEAGLEGAGVNRSQFVDANSFLYTAKAIQGFDLSTKVATFQTPVLFVAADTDLIFPPEVSLRARETLCGQGVYAEYAEIKGRGGHLDGLFKIAQKGNELAAFLARSDFPRKCSN